MVDLDRSDWHDLNKLVVKAEYPRSVILFKKRWLDFRVSKPTVLYFCWRGPPNILRLLLFLNNVGQGVEQLLCPDLNNNPLFLLLGYAIENSTECLLSVLENILSTGSQTIPVGHNGRKLH